MASALPVIDLENGRIEIESDEQLEEILKYDYEKQHDALLAIVKAVAEFDVEKFLWWLNAIRLVCGLKYPEVFEQIRDQIDVLERFAKGVRAMKRVCGRGIRS